MKGQPRPKFNGPNSEASRGVAAWERRPAMVGTGAPPNTGAEDVGALGKKTTKEKKTEDLGRVRTGRRLRPPKRGRPSRRAAGDHGRSGGELKICGGDGVGMPSTAVVFLEVTVLAMR